MASTTNAEKKNADAQREPIDYEEVITSTRDPRILAETIRFIVDQGGTVHKKKVMAHLQEKFSFDEKLKELNKTGIVKWRTALLFHLIGPVKSGFLKRDGSGEWRVTNEGRKHANTSPEEFSNACKQGYIGWKKTQSKPGKVHPGSIQHWRVKANSDWDQFAREEIAGCNWHMVGDIGQLNDSELKRLVKQAHADGEKISVKTYQDLLYIRDMPIGAVVVATDEKKHLVKAVGRVTGPYSFVDDDPVSHRRPVEWIEVKDRKIAKQPGTRRVAPASEELIAIVEEVGVNTEKKFWALSLGDDEICWTEFQSNNYVGSDFYREGSDQIFLEDVSGLSEDEIANRMRQEDPDGSKPGAAAAALFRFADGVNIGDIIIVKQGGHRVMGLCEVTGDYQCDEVNTASPHQRPVRWLSSRSFESAWPPASGIFSDVSEAAKELEKMIGQSPDADALRDSLDIEAVISPAQSIADNSFLDIDEADEILSLLESKRNLILQGAPGTGKTYLARQIAKRLTSREADSDQQWTLVQFHQSYGYEDFIEGYRPDSDGNFRIKDGVFKLFCKRAASDPNAKYVFVIDEINRGNLSRIFGELMVLLEHDKRGPEFSMSLAYSAGESEDFYVPKNVFILGLMNTADRSLAVVDYALRRRFAFYALTPRYKSKDFKDHLVSKGVSEKCIERISSTMTELNAAIADSRALGPGFVIGHSFFCPRESSISDGDQWIDRVMKYEIKPLLEEYCGSQQKLLERLVSIVSS